MLIFWNFIGLVFIDFHLIEMVLLLIAYLKTYFSHQLTLILLEFKNYDENPTFYSMKVWNFSLSHVW